MIKAGSFSQVNEHLARELKRVFPAEPLEVIDAKDLLLKAERLPRHCLEILGAYGPRAFFERAALRRAFYRTGYAFEALKQEMKRRVPTDRYLFTIQTQSLFDASVPNLPISSIPTILLALAIATRLATKPPRRLRHG